MSARAVALGLGLACALAACARGPAPPADHFWRLGPGFAGVSALPAPVLDGTLAVERFRGDGLLAERALLWSEAERPHELRPHAYHHWVEPPAAMLQERLAGYLRARGVADRVVTPELRLAPDYTVAGRLMRFERVLGDGPPRAVVELRLALRRTTGGEVLVNEVYHEEVEAAGTDVRDSIPAFDRAVQAAFARFVDQLPARSDVAGAGDRP